MPLPEPVRGQILPKVEAAGVNFSDVKRGRGDAYPFGTEFTFVPGSEIAGAVVVRGRGVDGSALGAQILALAGANGFGG